MEIYDKDFTKLICKKVLNSSYSELSLLKNGLIYIKESGAKALYDISQNDFKEIKDEKLKLKLDNIDSLRLSNTKMNYFSDKYDYQNKTHIVKILDDNFNNINIIDIGENINIINNIYEIPNLNLIIIVNIKKIIFWNTKEKKNIYSFNNNCKDSNYSFYNHYDNIINKNNKLYVGLNNKILILDIITLQMNAIIKLNEVNFFYCFYDLDKENILVAGDKNIYLINSKKLFVSILFKGIDGIPQRFEKINHNCFRIITSEGIIIYNINKIKK